MKGQIIFDLLPYEIKKKIIDNNINIKKFNRLLLSEYESVSNLLNDLFDWGGSNEGHAYYSNLAILYSKYEDLLKYQYENNPHKIKKFEFLILELSKIKNAEDLRFKLYSLKSELKPPTQKESIKPKPQSGPWMDYSTMPLGNFYNELLK